MDRDYLSIDGSHDRGALAAKEQQSQCQASSSLQFIVADNPKQFTAYHTITKIRTHVAKQAHAGRRHIAPGQARVPGARQRLKDELQSCRVLAGTASQEDSYTTSRVISDVHDLALRDMSYSGYSCGFAWELSSDERRLFAFCT